jgi:hypothetical protein
MISQKFWLKQKIFMKIYMSTLDTNVNLQNEVEIMIYLHSQKGILGL